MPIFLISDHKINKLNMVNQNKGIYLCIFNVPFVLDKNKYVIVMLF